jgi:ArsR family transcriptional regulator
MKATVAFAKALADPTRLRVVAALRAHELCVCELCDALEATQSTLSTHLTLLRQGGLVQTRKEGRWIYYGLSADVAPLTESFFEHFADMTRDKRVRRDADRVQRRLKLREDGCCVLGFNQLDSRKT